MNRRSFLGCIAAGGMLTAEGLWWPGKVISIPNRFTDNWYTRAARNCFDTPFIWEDSEKWFRDAYEIGIPDPETGERVPFQRQYTDLFS